MSAQSLIGYFPEAYSVNILRTGNSASARYWGVRFTTFVIALWVAALFIGFQRSLLALTLVGFLAAIAGLLWPTLGLFGMGMLCTLDTVSRQLLMRDSSWWHYNTYNYLLLVVALLSLSSVLKLRDPHTRLLQAFSLLLGIEILFSNDWQNGLVHLLNIVTVFGLLAYFVRAKCSSGHWYWIAIINGTLGALGGFVFFLQKNELPPTNHNLLAFFPLTAIFAICLCYSLFVHKQRKRIILGSLALVNYCWILLSGSRGALLIATLCIAFLLMMAKGISTRLAYLGVIVMVALLSSVVFPRYQEDAVFRLQRLLDPGRTFVSRTSGRSDLALAAWYMFLDHPFGVGTGGFASERIKEGYSTRTSGWGADNAMQAHAGWMKTLAENGVPGVALQVAFVLSFAVVGWRRKRHGLFSLGLLVTLALASAFVVTEVQTKGLWFLAAGAIVLLHQKHYFVVRSLTPEYETPEPEE